MSERSALSVTLVNERREIGRLIELVEAFGRRHGLVEDDVTDVNILLDEFVSNVIKYGHDDGLEHRIEVTLSLDGPLLTMRIEDDGKPFNPLDVPDPDLDLPIDERPVGGLGIFIAKTMTDSIEYARARDRNVLLLKKTTRSSPGSP